MTQSISTLNGTKTTVLVDLDSLLDMRIAIIDKIAPKIGSEIVKDWYHTRNVDNFGRTGTPLTDERFQEAYRNRSVKDISHATMTQMCVYINAVIMRYNQRAGLPFGNDSYSISVNINGYDLSDKAKDVLILSMTQYTGGIAEIDIVDIPLDDLTVDLIKRTFTHVIMYDFNAWLERHKERFSHVQMPEVTFLVPRLHIAGTTTEQLNKIETQVKEMMNEDLTDVFYRTSLALSVFVCIVWLDVRLFSFITSVEPSLDG